MDFSPSVATATMNRFVKDADLDVLYYRRITDAQVQNKRIKVSLWKTPNNRIKRP